MSQSLTLTAGELQVRFLRQGDRFAHQLWLASADGVAQLLLESQEGAAEDWPASPPLQQLHAEDRPGDVRVALLVGMAGKSHWSLSCEADPAARRITFDAACRLRATPTWLGSTYRLGPEIHLLGDLLTCPAGRVRLETSAAWQVEGSQLRLAPGATLAKELPCTVAWKYAFVVG